MDGRLLRPSATPESKKKSLKNRQARPTPQSSLRTQMLPHLSAHLSLSEFPQPM